MQPVDVALLGALALPLIAAHNLADHALQSDACASKKGSSGHEGRVACARHVGVVVLLQALAVLAVVALTATAVSPVAVVSGIALTAWSHYWFDRRTTAAGLYEAIGMTRFAKLGTPRPGQNDNPSLGSGSYRMDQDWHHLWLAISALVIASTGLLLVVLSSGAVMLMVAAIVASRAGRRTLSQQS